jgi:cytochrome c biogenesis protein CcdA
MGAVLLLVASIALADSINPSTILPGALLAPGSRRALLAFTAGVFSVSFLAGAAVVLGPGELLVGHVHPPRRAVRHDLELGAGIVLIAAAAAVWLTRGRLTRAMARVRPRGGSGFVLGAGIMAAEIPTALPYFAALAAIIASGQRLATQLVLVAVYNVLFVLPLLALFAVIVAAGARADELLWRLDVWLREHVASLVTTILAVAGVALLAFGAAGVAGWR